MQVSEDELTLRWKYAFGEIDIKEEEMREHIKEIRERTGKP